jgi:hypothetical protein
MDKDRIQRLRETADLFLQKDKNVFIKDINGNIYFCKILLVGEETLRIDIHGPMQRAGENATLYWPMIVKLEEEGE